MVLCKHLSQDKNFIGFKTIKHKFKKEKDETVWDMKSQNPMELQYRTRLQYAVRQATQQTSDSFFTKLHGCLLYKAKQQAEFSLCAKTRVLVHQSPKCAVCSNRSSFKTCQFIQLMAGVLGWHTPLVLIIDTLHWLLFSCSLVGWVPEELGVRAHAGSYVCKYLCPSVRLVLGPFRECYTVVTE